MRAFNPERGRGTATTRMCEYGGHSEVEAKAMTKRDAFRVGDRVELMLFYGFHGEPCPRGTVVSVGRTIHCKMDRNGKVVRFEPSDLRVIDKRKAIAR